MNDKSLVTKVANRYGIEPTKLLSSLKATAFRQKDGEVSNEQMLALLVVADQYGLNPWTKEIYAYPDKQGIVPVVGVDGWSRIINSHPQFDGVDFNYAEKMLTPEGGKPCPEWCEAVLHRKDRSHPTVVREYLDEVYRPPFTGTKNGREFTANGPWQSHTKRMLRHKVLIQASRIAFGFTGIFDEDEAARIQEQRDREVVVTVEPERPALPELGEDEFETNLQKWQTQISKGMDPEDLLAMLETRWTFSEEQREAVLNTPIEVEEVA
jgi:phage recombination protein Bet